MLCSGNEEYPGHDVAAWAYFQVNMALFQGWDQIRILDTADSMPDPLGSDLFQGFPDAFRAPGFPCVRGAKNTMLANKAERFQVLVQGVGRLVCGNVKPCDQRPLEVPCQLGGLHALGGVVVPERAKNQPGLHAGMDDGFAHGTFHVSHHLPGA